MGCTLAAIRTVTHVILKYALDDGSRPSIRLAVARHSLELTRSIPGSQLASIALNPIYCMTYLLIHYNHNLLESFHLPRLQYRYSPFASSQILLTRNEGFNQFRKNKMSTEQETKQESELPRESPSGVAGSSQQQQQQSNSNYKPVSTI